MISSEIVNFRMMNGAWCALHPAVFKRLIDFRAYYSSQLQFHTHTHTHCAFLRTSFLNSSEVLTASLLLPGYSALPFSHYSSQKYEIKWPPEHESLWELTPCFCGSPVIYLLFSARPTSATRSVSAPPLLLPASGRSNRTTSLITLSLC